MSLPHPNDSLRKRIWNLRGAAAFCMAWFFGFWLAAGAAIPGESDGPGTRSVRTHISNGELHDIWGLGPWIWGPRTYDKQTCRMWRTFDLPVGAKVESATIRISVDNGYRLMLDGREIGTGSDWRSVTEYDLGQSLKPGPHVLAVEAFNDNREAGMQFGLNVQLRDGRSVKLFSDTDWRIVPASSVGWETMLMVPPRWDRAIEAGLVHSTNGQWKERAPTMLMKVSVPPPVKRSFVNSLWFQVCLWLAVAVAMLMCLWLMTRLAVQSKAHELLRRERARIARDIHDELGARLTELALEGEVIRTELPEGSPVLSKLDALCEKAREVSGAMDEVVWMVNSKRDTLRDFANYACKHARRFLDASPIRCRLDVTPDLPEVILELPVRRSLLLGVKEALNNAAKYSNATELFLRIFPRGHNLFVVVEDNGSGFDLERIDPERNGVVNMTEGMREVGGRCRITTSSGAGCQVEFQVPLPRQVIMRNVPEDTSELPHSAVPRSSGRAAI